MPATGPPLPGFVKAADQVLTRRVANSPPARKRGQVAAWLAQPAGDLFGLMRGGHEDGIQQVDAGVPRKLPMTKKRSPGSWRISPGLLELKGENPFKIRAYVNAARALETLGEDLEQMIDRRSPPGS